MACYERHSHSSVALTPPPPARKYPLTKRGRCRPRKERESLSVLLAGSPVQKRKAGRGRPFKKHWARGRPSKQ